MSAGKKAPGGAGTRRGGGDEVGRILAEQFFAPASTALAEPDRVCDSTMGLSADEKCPCGPPEDLAEAVRALPELDALPELKVTATRTPPNGLARPPQGRTSAGGATVAGPEAPAEKKRKTGARVEEGEKEKCAKPRPEHYKVVCISMYTEDLSRLDEMVTELKRRGFSRANRSSVLRLAVEQLDLRLARKGL